MDQYKQIWDTVFELLKNRLTDTVANLWFGDAKLLHLDEKDARIDCSSAIKRKFVMNSHVESLKIAFEEILGYKVNVTVGYPGITEQELNENIPIRNQAQRDTSSFNGNQYGQGSFGSAHNQSYSQNSTMGAYGNSAPSENGSAFIFDPFKNQAGSEVSHEAEVKSAEPVEEAEIVKKSSLNSDYTFDTFIVGNSNKFAYSASYAVAKDPANDYNPLFIYGQSGLGKTHLLNAIMNELFRQHPEMIIMYVKGDEFTNQMIESIRKKNQDDFRLKYRKADVLLIDDIQFIAGKESTQEEFFHTFNALYEDGKQIIMTSDRPPKDIKLLEDRLKTRFEWGLTVDVQPPDFELRLAIIQDKAKAYNVEMSDEMLTYIAENLRSNIRQLEGSVKKIKAKTFLSGDTLTMSLVKECISSLITGDESPMTTADKIISLVAKKYDLSKDDILSKKRDQNIAYARNVSIYIIRRVTNMSFPDIGKIFNRDHSTIMSSNRVIQEKVKNNHLSELEINEVIRELSE